MLKYLKRFLKISKSGVGFKMAEKCSRTLRPPSRNEGQELPEAVGSKWKTPEKRYLMEKSSIAPTTRLRCL